MSDQVPERPTKEDYQQWKANPVTEWWFYFLQAEFQGNLEGIVLGQTVDTESVDSTALSSVKEISRCSTLYEVGNIDYEGIVEALYPKQETEDDDDDPFRE